MILLIASDTLGKKENILMGKQDVLKTLKKSEVIACSRKLRIIDESFMSPFSFYVYPRV